MNCCACGCGEKVKNKYVNGHNWKGKHHSKNTKEKMSILHNGQYHSKETKIKMSKKHTGLHHSKETKEKLRLSKMGKPTNWNKGMIAWNKGIKGDKSHNWQGGISFFPYSTKFTRELKQFIKDRDENECSNPGCDRKTSKLIVHHINYDKQDCSQFNLITLCNSCNIKANFNRREWKRFYKKIIWSKY